MSLIVLLPVGMGATNATDFNSNNTGATVVPVETTMGGTPSPTGTPTGTRLSMRSVFGGGTTGRVSGMELREQIRGEMYDPEKETNVLCSCF